MDSAAVLVWLSVGLVAVSAWPAARFARRAWRFRALPTVRLVICFQVAGLVLVTLFALLSPRPDLGGWGWFAVALAATLLPLAVGDAVQSPPGVTRRAALALSAAAAVLTLGIGALAALPAFATVTVAGRVVPVTEKTLTEGYQLAVRIPAGASGFHARDAHLFVPPGFIRDPSATRPVVEMMMGQPGNPTLGATLDALHSLGGARLDAAPFVLVVDQLGANDKNPPCSDTSAGRLETYLADDVPAWIRASLPVSRDRADWVIAGFSHGGECAAFLGATHPGTWATVVDVSGPDKPGEYRSDRTRDRYYGGSDATYEATWPVNILAATDYAKTPMRGIFVAGELDDHFRPQVEETATAAENAGWTVTYWAVPGEGHSGPTLTKGLTTAYNQLIPLWTKSGATSAGDRALCSPGQPPRACGLGVAAGVAGATAMLDLGLLAAFLGAQLLLFFTRRPRAEAPASTGVETPLS